MKSLLILLICSYSILSPASCGWDAPPIYCGKLILKKFEAAPDRYYKKDCVITAQVIQVSNVYQNSRAKKFDRNEIVEITAAPSQCPEFEKLIGQTVTRKIVSVCEDIFGYGKPGGPGLDFSKDKEPCQLEESAAIDNPSPSPSTILPLACDPLRKDAIQPYLSELKSKTKPIIWEYLKRTAPKDLGVFDVKYRSFISGTFLKPKHMNQGLIDIYRSAGVKSGEDMIQDLLEGVWIDGDTKKCDSIKRKLMPVDQSKIEDITTPKSYLDK